MKNKIVRHTFYWMLYVVLNSLVYSQNSEDFIRQAKAFLFYMPFTMTIVYATVYFLIPRYLMKQRILLFIAGLLIIGFTGSLAERTANYFILIPWLFPEYADRYQILSTSLIGTMISNYLIVSVGSAGKLFYYWYENQKAKQELAEEKLKTELKFLKAQVHPHFLFNTLNNLYVLVKKKSDKAPDLVMKLSNILRYMLYEINTEFVPLSKEISIIKDYIDIEKIRHSSSLSIDLKITGEIKGKMIAPVILLPFVENCFKHGISGRIADKWIKIEIKIEDDFIDCRFENSREINQQEDKDGYREGIGLNNVKKRLSIIYRNDYSMKINDQDEIFCVQLQIKFN
ncbi:MAG: histidine kinase [Melioribacteraceae bacterium]|nr:histidine kinase [Melioribacteraceae bacterium]MCF8356194.1 histidine kinase [Melioribacteraceae bacterium]MCF8394692.1 histidine kinase [Melioribacteraceae bacterium]MCF8420230.1 histidine kinase [Melioribacteraceae bacterium]